MEKRQEVIRPEGTFWMQKVPEGGEKIFCHLHAPEGSEDLGLKAVGLDAACEYPGCDERI